MKRNLARLDVVALADEFAEAAREHAAASWEGDSRVANRAYKRIKEVEKRLVNAGPAGRDALLGLLDSSSVAVRGWAAACMLRLGSERAVAVLEQIAAGPPCLEQLDAEMLLRQWKQRPPDDAANGGGSHRDV